MIINIPIEPIEMRYSVQWDQYFRLFFGSEAVTVTGNKLTDKIERGKFLDITGTNFYKSSQLMELIKSIHSGYIGDGDILFFHDLWFPGIEQLFYIRDALNLDFKITGCLHAGSYDPNDFLYQQNMGGWAVHFEHCLFSGVNQIYVATNFHKNLICKGRSIDHEKIKVTGFPIFHHDKITKERENIVVFPHRLDKEKHPEIFDSLSDSLYDKGWKWIKTAETEDKSSYYATLKKSKVAISFSSQETWGIAMQEAVLCGCIPLVPDDLSYSEMYLDDFKYRTPFEARSMLIHYMEKANTFLDKQVDLIKEKGKNAMPLIAEHMNGLIR